MVTFDIVNIILNVYEFHMLYYTGEECVLLAGGRNLSAVHNDCFIVNTNTWKIEKVCANFPFVCVDIIKFLYR